MLERRAHLAPRHWRNRKGNTKLRMVLRARFLYELIIFKYLNPWPCIGTSLGQIELKHPEMLSRSGSLFCKVVCYAQIMQTHAMATTSIPQPRIGKHHLGLEQVPPKPQSLWFENAGRSRTTHAMMWGRTTGKILVDRSAPPSAPRYLSVPWPLLNA